MLKHTAQHGFTLIELSVALAIVGLMLVLGVPSMTSFFQNAKLGSASQTFLSGLQTARAEAIRRNQPVEFALTTTTSAIATDAAAAGAVVDANGAGWVVRYLDADTAAYKLVEARPVGENAGGSTSAVRVQGSAVAPAPAFTGVISFNGFGGTTTGYEYRLNLDNPTGGECAPTGPMRCLQVRASPGGQIKVCDPIAVVGDSRAC